VIRRSPVAGTRLPDCFPGVAPLGIRPPRKALLLGLAPAGEHILLKAYLNTAPRRSAPHAERVKKILGSAASTIAVCTTCSTSRARRPLPRRRIDLDGRGKARVSSTCTSQSGARSILTRLTPLFRGRRRGLGDRRSSSGERR